MNLGRSLRNEDGCESLLFGRCSTISLFSFASHGRLCECAESLHQYSEYVQTEETAADMIACINVLPCKLLTLQSHDGWAGANAEGLR